MATLNQTPTARDSKIRQLSAKVCRIIGPSAYITVGITGPWDYRVSDYRSGALPCVYVLVYFELSYNMCLYFYNVRSWS